MTTIATVVHTDSSGLMLVIGIAPKLGSIQVRLEESQGRLLIGQLRGAIATLEQLRQTQEKH